MNQSVSQWNEVEWSIIYLLYHSPVATKRLREIWHPFNIKVDGLGGCELVCSYCLFNIIDLPLSLSCSLLTCFNVLCSCNWFTWLRPDEMAKPLYSLSFYVTTNWSYSSMFLTCSFLILCIVVYFTVFLRSIISQSVMFRSWLLFMVQVRHW